jgi:hypothetical protein
MLGLDGVSERGEGRGGRWREAERRRWREVERGGGRWRGQIGRRTEVDGGGRKWTEAERADREADRCGWRQTEGGEGREELTKAFSRPDILNQHLIDQGHLSGELQRIKIHK